MAVDKLVDSTQLDADLTSVADVIRTAGGTLLPLSFPNDYVVAIGDIGNTEIKTASGSIAHFEDALARKAQDLTVAIEPVQSGSGDPSPDNVRPISGWTGANVTRTGVNVWDEEWENGYLGNSGVLISDSSSVCSKNYIPIKQSESFYGKCLDGKSLRICAYNGDKTFISLQSVTNAAFTLPAETAYIKFSIYGYGTTYANDVSINYPSTDHDYHSGANKTTYSITFPTEAGTVYGGTLDVVNGKMTVDRAMVDLGTLSYTYYPDYNTFVVFIENKAIGQGPNYGDGMVCSAYPTSAYIWYSGYKPDKSIGGTDGKGIAIKDSTYTNVPDFKNAMSGVQLVYGLATPIVYDLDPVTVTTLLGTNNVWADTGDSTIKYIAPKAQIPSAQGVYF